MSDAPLHAGDGIFYLGLNTLELVCLHNMLSEHAEARLRKTSRRAAVVERVSDLMYSKTPLIFDYSPEEFEIDVDVISRDGFFTEEEMEK